eukprot:Colp12_sorted_trinity150504_noHs@14765
MKIINNSDVSSETGSIHDEDVQTADVEAAPDHSALSHVERINMLLNVWDKSDEAAEVSKFVANPLGKGVHKRSLKMQSSWATQFSILTRRSLANALRNKLIVKAKIGQTIFFSILVGLIFLRLGHTQSSIQDRQGALFFLAVNAVMSSAMGVLSVFGPERVVFAREYSSGFYALSPYFIAKIGVELPFQIVFPFLSTCIYYWMVGFQNTARNFFLMAIVNILLNCAGSSIGILAASVWSDLAVALAVLPMILLPLMIFSGFFVNTETIPPYFDWIKWLSPMKYGFVALSKIEFPGLTFVCDPPSATSNTTACFNTGEEVLDRLGFGGQGSIGANIAALAGLYGVCLVFAFLGLWRIVRAKK